MERGQRLVGKGGREREGQEPEGYRRSRGLEGEARGMVHGNRRCS